MYNNKFVLILIFFGLVACNSKTENKTQTTNQNKVETVNGTQEMVKYLSRMAKNANPQYNYHLNSLRAKLYHDQLNRENNPNKKFTATATVAMEYMNAGNVNYALQLLNDLKNTYKIPEKIDKNTKDFYELFALAYLRLGETENCIKNHTKGNCIIPLQKNGFHKEKLGSQQAKIWLTKLLEFNPTDEKSKWLLNLAYITLGEYPAKVPKKYLIKNLNTANATTKFKDIGSDLGIAINALSGGLCIEDFNKDGNLDIVASSYGYKDQVKYFELKNGTFVDKTKAANLTGITGGLNMIHADYNNDGFEDVLILRGGWLKKGGYQANSLLKNMGNGTFEDVTKQAGLFTELPTQTAAFADIDLDGDLDLFIGNEAAVGITVLSQLFVNQGDGTFIENAAQLGIRINAFVKGCTFADFNNDGWQDLYVSILEANNKLYLNKNGKFELSTVAEKPYFSFPCWSWDVNNDGLEDLFVANYDTRFERTVAQEFSKYAQQKDFESDKPALYINKGNLKFEEVSKSYGTEAPLFAMGSNFGDYNNDGFLDFYIGSGSVDFSSIIPNYFFENKQGKAFENITLKSGTGHIQKGHAIAFADFDKDGDEDIYAVMGGAYEGDKYPNVLFENPSKKVNFLKIKLIGTKSNKSAIGARLQLKYTDKKGKKQKIFRTVDTGGSFGSAPLTVHFGLKNAKQIDKLIITWVDKNRSKQVFKNLKNNFNQLIEITEGKKDFVIKDYQKITFKKSKHAHHHH